MYFEFCELESTVFTEWICVVTPVVHLNKISNLKRLPERGFLTYLKIIGMAYFVCFVLRWGSPVAQTGWLPLNSLCNWEALNKWSFCLYFPSAKHGHSLLHWTRLVFSLWDRLASTWKRLALNFCLYYLRLLSAGVYEHVSPSWGRYGPNPD